jgi:hypothetical protein
VLKDLEKVCEELRDLHLSFCEANRGKPNSSQKFNYRYFREHCPLAASALDRDKSTTWQELLVLAGLDANCHIGQFSYGKTTQQRKETFKLIVAHFVHCFGLEALNDNQVNSLSLMQIPNSLTIHSRSTICEEQKCEPFKLTFKSFYAQGRRLYGTWENAINAVGIDYNKEVLRRTANYDIEQVIKDFDEWDKNLNGKWAISDLRKTNVPLEKAIRNSFLNKNRTMPFSSISENAVFIAWINLKYFRSFGELAENLDWWDKNSNTLVNTFELNHEAQETWSKDKIQTGIQKIYSRGPAAGRLSRHWIEQNNLREDKKLWAALRQTQYRASGQFEREWLKDAGFIPDRLEALYREIDQPYTIGELANFFATMMKESIDNNENRLSREYVSSKHPEIHNHLINRFRSWQGALRYFGLDPKFYQISASRRTKRGYIFQEFFCDLLERYGLKQVASNPRSGEFVYNKMLLGCGHKPKCRPDFLFSDLIIDTKTGYHVSQKPEQIMRYLDHNSNIVILTLNDKFHKIKIGNDKITVVGFSDFIPLSNNLLGTQVNASETEELTKALRRQVIWG